MTPQLRLALEMALKSKDVVNEIIALGTALNGDVVLEFSSTTSTHEATTGVFSKEIEIIAKDSLGNIHSWLNQTFTSKVTGSTTSSTGTVTVGSANITFIDGRALVILNGLTSNDTAGSQVIGVGGAKTGGSSTGLTNDATVYTATIVVDGVSKAITVTGSAAQTYTPLLAAINADLGASATASIVSGNIKVVSATTGTSSSVAITDGTLCAALTGFTAIASATAGTAAGFIATETATLTIANLTIAGVTATGGTHVVTIV